MKTIEREIHVEKLLDELFAKKKIIVRRSKKNDPSKRVVAIMAKEVLVVPEGRLLEVVRVIRAGLLKTKKTVSVDTRKDLKRWCDQEEKRLNDAGYE